MTIASEIARLQGVKADILGAIAEKKVDVPAGAMLADAPELIRSIKSGINVKIGQGIYPAVKIGNQLWLAKNLDEELGTLGVDEWYYNGRSEKTRLNTATTLTRTISSTSASDVSVVLYAGAESYIVGKPVFIHFDVDISTPVNIDLNIALYFKYGSSYYSTGSFTIKAGDTSVAANASISIPANADLSSFSSFIRLNRSVAAFQPTSTIATISDFRVFQSSVDGGTGAITWEQAIANEATAKAKNYGRLYTWNNVNDNIGKLGLTKWRWPTRADFDALVAIDPTGKMFRNKSFGNGTDDFGFSAIESGSFANGTFSPRSFFIWSQNQNRIRIDLSSCSIASTILTAGFSLRLVMDLNEDGTIPDSNIVLEDVPATTAEPLALASEPIVTEEEAE